MTQAICDITTDEVNVDVVVEPQADTMVEVANRAGGMEQVFHDNTLIGNGNSVDLGVNTEIIATKEYVDEKVEFTDTYTKDEIDDKFTVANAQIDANADAIQKTREDYINADSEIHQILNAHASELTTQRNDIDGLGDQVSAIEEKIPETASAENPLVTRSEISSVYKFKGSVATYNDLPTGATVGDVYNVTDTGANYAWDGSAWDKLSETVDLSSYATTAYVNAREQDIRADYMQADSELQQQINAHATAITNLDGEIDTINGKIPASASTTNLLATISDLDATEQDVRDDYMAADADLQTQINGQATAISTNTSNITALTTRVGTNETNIALLDSDVSTINTDVATAKTDIANLKSSVNSQAGLIQGLQDDVSEKVDKNQGTANAGKILSVGSDGQVTLTSAPGGGLTAVVHDSTLTGTGTDASPLGIASTVLAEIADKAEQTTVETLSGVVSQNTTNIGTLRTDVDDLGDQVSGIEGKIPESTSTTNQLVNATQLSEAIAAKQDQLTAGENITIVDNVISASGGGTTLPDQTGNENTFLMTDGATPSWSTDRLVVKSGGVAIGTGARAYDSSTRASVAIGKNANAGGFNCVSIGSDSGGDANLAISIGKSAKANALYAIQIGGGSNNDASTFKVGNANGNFEMMSADGTIPAERMSATAGTTGQVLTKTDTGMAWADASGGDGDIDCGVMS